MKHRRPIGKPLEPETFGSALYALRRQLALSQSIVAARARISTSYYSELENSKRAAPPRGTALRIARALQLEAIEAEDLASLAGEERLDVQYEAQLPPKVRQLVATIRAVAPQLRAELVDSLHAKIKEACM
jgi:transcriptional regulator with XRE-family HTH domain